MVFGIIILCIGITISSAIGISYHRNDITPPVTTATLDPPEPNNNGWYNTFVQVTLNATDNESGVNATYYQINEGEWEIYTHSFYVPEAGFIVIEFYSIDNAGNIEAPKQVELKVDIEPPTLTISFNPSSPNGNNGWYNSNITVTVNATDSLSGVNGTWYWKDNQWQIYTGPFNLTEHFTSTRICSKDNADNVEYSGQDPGRKIDTTPPEITMDYTWEGNLWQGWDFLYTATAIDAMSGMDRVEFYKNDELQKNITSPGPTYEWTDEHYFPSFQKLQVRGFICNLNMTNDYVTFYAILVLNLGFEEIYPHIRAYAYDSAGNWDYAEIEQPSKLVTIPPGTYISLSLFQKVTLPNDYEGYIGRFFINATFYNRWMNASSLL
jgi:hypothetical protein